MTIVQDFQNHNGGNIAFGPDGFLYAGWGDGGSGGDPNDRGQDTTNLLGTFTRIDVDGAVPYGIPATNPFAGNANCVQGFGAAPCPEIFAWGFRNPWRWSFDSQTGELWAGDVGQNSFEEIDRVVISGNYGWDEREGAHCFEPAQGCATSFIDPITEYGRNLGVSVTGGYVYRGNDIAVLQGMYVYGDFGTGRIWTVPANSPQGTVGTEILNSGLNISSFAVDSTGELYVLDYGGDVYLVLPSP
jgi:glucose/arabinose dehydrogenase